MRNRRSESESKPVDCWDVQCVVDVSWALGKQILIKACRLQLVQASLIEAGKLHLRVIEACHALVALSCVVVVS